MRDQQKKNFKGLFEIGQPVYCSLYGGKHGFIYGINGDQSPDTCETMGGGVVCMGGSCKVDIVWDTGSISKANPESLIRSSVQWAVFTREEIENREDAAGYVPEGFATDDYIQELLQSALDNKATEEGEREQKAEAKAKEREELPAKYPYLITAEEHGKYANQVLAAKNIRIALKREFPGQKFTVKSSSFANGDSVDISWTDGPTTEQVTKITGRHQYGYFNGMEDLYEYNGNVFPDVFGRSKYVQENRKISHETRDKIAEELGYKDLERDEDGNIKDTSGDISRHIYQVSREKSFYVKPETVTAAPVAKPAKSAPSTAEVVKEFTERQGVEETDREPVEIGDYRGHPTIKLPHGTKGFCFGIAKAAAILEYIDEIKDFIDNN